MYVLKIPQNGKSASTIVSNVYRSSWGMFWKTIKWFTMINICFVFQYRNIKSNPRRSFFRTNRTTISSFWHLDKNSEWVFDLYIHFNRRFLRWKKTLFPSPFFPIRTKWKYLPVSSFHKGQSRYWIRITELLWNKSYIFRALEMSYCMKKADTFTLRFFS